MGMVGLCVHARLRPAATMWAANPAGSGSNRTARRKRMRRAAAESRRAAGSSSSSASESSDAEGALLGCLRQVAHHSSGLARALRFQASTDQKKKKSLTPGITTGII